MGHRNTGFSAETIENAFGLLRQVLGAALEDNRIARNPCDGVRLPKRQHADRGYLTHAQVSALADAVDRQPEVVRLARGTSSQALPACFRHGGGTRPRWFANRLSATRRV